VSDSYSVVLTTAGSQEEAESLATGLVEGRLVACAQLLPIRSVYAWEGSVEHDAEVLLLLKAQTDAYSSIESYILANHSYDTPEVIQIAVTQGSSDYLSWITSSSGRPT
jgi:periplasmic divalent cation tolerance protein